MINMLSGLHHNGPLICQQQHVVGSIHGKYIFPPSRMVVVRVAQEIFIRILHISNLMTMLKPILAVKFQLNSMDLISVSIILMTYIT